jgi:hypothetical protein
MWKPPILKPIATSMALLYGVGYGIGLFKDVPTKAITLIAQAGSSVATGTLTMPNMMGDGQFDVRPVGDTRRAAVTISPST